MDARLLDVLEDTADVDALAVAQRVEIDLDGPLEEAVEVDGVVGRDLGRLAHVLLELGAVVDDRHATTAEHVARTHEQREADAVGNPARLLERGGLARGGIGDRELVEDGGEALAVLGEVDGLGLRAHDRHTRLEQRLGELERGLAAQRHDDAVGTLGIDDVHDVLVGERLEVQLVGGVVVGRHRLGVAVDHDGLVALVVQRVRGMDAAVVELDALADAVGAGAEDHDALFVARLDLGLVRVIGLVVVGGLARELGRARVDRLECGHDADTLAMRADGKLVGARQVRDLDVGQAVALGDAHRVGVDLVKRRAAQRLLHGDDVGHARDEEAVDAAGAGDLVHRPAAAQRLAEVVHALRRRAGDELLDVGFGSQSALAVGAQARAAVLEGAQRLAKRLLEGAPDRHDLADRLHAGRQRVVGALELLEGEARHLDDAVVDRGLEARRRRLGDVVDDLVEREADRELCRRLGDREAGRLGCERGGTRDARVHLDDDHAPVGGIHRELHVGAAGFDADLLQDGQRGGAHALVLDVGERLGGRDRDGVAGVHAHGVEVLDGAHDDAVAGPIAHDLHLVLFPALDALLDEHLARRRELEALGDDLDELLGRVGDAAARAAERVGGAQDDGVSELADDALRVLDRVRVAGSRRLDAQLGHAVVEQLAVLAALDGRQIAADHLDAVLVEDALLRQLDRGVEAGLAAQRREQRVGTLLGDDLLDELGGDGLDVGAVGQARIGHDRGGIAVHQDDAVAVGLEDLARLGAGIVELARLADDDGAGADDEDAFDVFALGHVYSSPPEAAFAGAEPNLQPARRSAAMSISR